MLVRVGLVPGSSKGSELDRPSVWGPVFVQKGHYCCGPVAFPIRREFPDCLQSGLWHSLRKWPSEPQFQHLTSQVVGILGPSYWVRGPDWISVDLLSSQPCISLVPSSVARRSWNQVCIGDGRNSGRGRSSGPSILWSVHTGLFTGSLYLGEIIAGSGC